MRLKTISQALSEAWQRAGDQQRRRAARLACELAVLQSGLRGAAADTALEILRGERDAPTEAARCEVEALSERLDAEYLGPQERDEPAARLEARLLFRRARAAAALHFALSADPEQLHEVLYEAAFAADDRDEAPRSVAMALF